MDDLEEEEDSSKDSPEENKIDRFDFDVMDGDRSFGRSRIRFVEF